MLTSFLDGPLFHFHSRSDTWTYFPIHTRIFNNFHFCGSFCVHREISLLLRPLERSFTEIQWRVRWTAIVFFKPRAADYIHDFFLVSIDYAYKVGRIWRRWYDFDQGFYESYLTGKYRFFSFGCRAQQLGTNERAAYWAIAGVWAAAYWPFKADVRAAKGSPHEQSPEKSMAGHFGHYSGRTRRKKAK